MQNLVKFTYQESIEETEKIYKAFQEYGVIHIDNIFSKELCSKAIKALKDCEQLIGDNLNEVGLVTEKIEEKILIKYHQGLFSMNPIFRKFFSNKLMKISESLLKKEDVYFSDIETHIRNPGGSSIPKHQDNFYFNLSKAKGLTCYIALNPHDIYLGGLNYILGSHIKRVIPHSLSKEAGFSSGITGETIKKKGLDSKRIYHPIYKTGSITIHHPENIHFANAVSKDSRRSFALSVRIFSSSEIIDQEGVKRYKKLLSDNRI